MNNALLKTNIEAEPTDLGNTKEMFETIVKIKTMSEEADPASDCSILRDLEDFIELYRALPLSRHALRNAQVLLQKSFCHLKRTEIEFAALQAKLSEQNDFIYNSEQKLYKLFNENLHLKSRIDLEKKVSLKDKSAVQIDLAKSEQSSNLNNNNSSIHLIDTPTPREI